MTPSAKYSLTAKEKAKHEIPKMAEAYLFMWDKINQEYCAEIDDFVENDGFEITHRDLQATAGDVHDYSLIAYRPIK